MAKPAPTPEQQQIIETARDGQPLVIEAGAGTGKTSTLRMLAEDRPDKSMLYLAYNKAIQVEASTSFPSNVEARTAHSLAYRQFGAKFRHRLNGKRINARQYAANLGIRAPFEYEMADEKHTIEPKGQAILVREAIGRFCNSADDEPQARHIYADGMDRDNLSRLQAHLLPYLRAAWEDIQSPRGYLSFTHDCYLKMWSLSRPQLPYSVILFDEAQDANPAIQVVVEAQDAAQQIMVGDRAQAIYGWRGAVDAMQTFQVSDGHRLMLTQSFRFGNAVAEQANRWLNVIGTPLRLRGFEPIASTVGDIEKPDAILCRTNAGCIESAMKYQEQGHRVAIAGGTSQIEQFVKGANDLIQGIGTDHPDLAAFNSWSDVQQAVKSGEASDLGMMVRLVDNYGTHAILEVCRNSTKPEDADITVSTGHKAKGLEWDAVQIHSDFKAPKEGGTVSVTEAMLIYVAVTRAKKQLDNRALAWFDLMEAEINQAMDNGDDEGLGAI